MAKAVAEYTCSCKGGQFCGPCTQCDEQGHMRFKDDPPVEIGILCDVCAQPPRKGLPLPLLLIGAVVLLLILLNVLYRVPWLYYAQRITH